MNNSFNYMKKDSLNEKVVEDDEMKGKGFEKVPGLPKLYKIKLKGGIPIIRPKSTLNFRRGLKKNYQCYKHQNWKKCNSLFI